MNNYPIILFTLFNPDFTFFRRQLVDFFNPLLNIKPALRPIELIKKRLSDLEKINLDSKLDIKLFYSELTYALRSFLKKKYMKEP